MKILAIDSSGLVASVAILTEDKLIGEYAINNKKTHSQTLLPMIDEVVQMTEIDLNDIDAIAVAAGPGSFTGLRIGSATAKGIAFTLNKPIVSVPTLLALAFNLYGTKDYICSMIDARNNQVFAGIYQYQEDKMVTIVEQNVFTIDELIAKVNETNHEVIFLGDGVSVYKQKLEDEVKVVREYAPANFRLQRAGAVGMAAFQLYSEGKIVTANSHVPEYLRLSQAEREMKEKMSKSNVE